MTTRRSLASGLSRIRRPRLAPSGPRPNALPLHNVRQMKGPPLQGCAFRQHSPSAKRAERMKPVQITSEGCGAASSRSTALSGPFGRDAGGARRDRTDDLKLAKHALSQLSYGPVTRPAGGRRPVVVGLGGLEPPTSRLSSARSNQLSYKPGRKQKSCPRPCFRQSRRKSSTSLKSERETKAARSRKRGCDSAA